MNAADFLVLALSLVTGLRHPLATPVVTAPQQHVRVWFPDLRRLCASAVYRQRCNGCRRRSCSFLSASYSNIEKDRHKTHRSANRKFQRGPKTQKNELVEAFGGTNTIESTNGMQENEELKS